MNSQEQNQEGGEKIIPINATKVIKDVDIPERYTTIENQLEDLKKSMPEQITILENVRDEFVSRIKNLHANGGVIVQGIGEIVDIDLLPYLEQAHWNLQKVKFNNEESYQRSKDELKANISRLKEGKEVIVSARLLRLWDVDINEIFQVAGTTATKDAIFCIMPKAQRKDKISTTDSPPPRVFRDSVVERYFITPLKEENISIQNTGKLNLGHFYYRWAMSNVIEG